MWITELWQGDDKMPAEKQKSVEERARKLVASELGVELSKVTLEASFTQHLGADWKDMVRIFLSAEQAFSIEIPEHDEEEVDNLIELVGCVVKNGGV